MSTYPNEIAMPIGFFPESIVIDGAHAYVASMTTGDIRKVDLRSGTSAVLSAGDGQRSATGLKLDAQGRLFVCGGASGMLHVLDSTHGSTITSYPLGSDNVFANDVLITPEAAYVTDSFTQVLYKLPLGPHGELPDAEAVITLPITGDMVYKDLAVYGGAFNSNGLVTSPDRSCLLVVQTNSGNLYRVESASGVSSQVDLGGENLLWADGMLIEGNLLYVVQSLSNMLTVIEVEADGRSGRVVDRRTDNRFDSPTSIARFGSRFFLTNARFGNADPVNAEFNIIAIPA